MCLVTGDTLAYMCVSSGDFTATTIRTSVKWARLTPPILTAVQTSDATPLDEWALDNAGFDGTNHREWYDTNFILTAEMLASPRIEVYCSYSVNAL